MFDQVMLYILHLNWYLDRILLVPIHTLCFTCCKLNESLLYVQVFQDKKRGINIYFSYCSQPVLFKPQRLEMCTVPHSLTSVESGFFFELSMLTNHSF